MPLPAVAPKAAGWRLNMTWETLPTVVRFFTPTWDILGDHYAQAYAGRRRLVLKKVQEYYRTYDWS